MGGWDRVTGKIGEFFGITIGGSGNLGDSNHNDRRYINTIREQFSLWVDTGAFMEMTIHQWPPDRLTIPILLENRSLKTRIGPVFWHRDMPQNLSRTETDNYINHRINDFSPYLERLRGRNVEILLANEPLWQWGSNQGWIDSPLYRAYGQNWITEAFVRLHTELQSKGLNYGTDYHVMLINEYDIEIPTPKANFIIQTVSRIERDIEQRLGQNIDFTIGLQFHVGADADGYIRVDPNYLADERNIPALINHFQQLSSLGRLSVTEFDFDGKIDPITQAKIIHNLFNAILKSGVFNDFTSWSTLRQNNDFKPNFFDLNTYQPTHNYYTLINTIIENSTSR